jgi:hypothetical protein
MDRTPITGKEGCEIEVKTAAEWTRNHRIRYPHGTISQFFGIEILQRLLQQPECMGIRIYYANSKPVSGWQRFFLAIANFFKAIAGGDGEVHLVLTGATAEGLDQIPSSGEMAVGSDSVAPKVLIQSNVAAPAPDPGPAPVAAAPAVAGKNILVEQSMPCPGAAGCPQNILTN